MGRPLAIGGTIAGVTIGGGLVYGFIIRPWRKRRHAKLDMERATAEVNVEYDTDDTVMEFADLADLAGGYVFYNSETGQAKWFETGELPKGWQRFPKGAALDDIIGRWELRHDPHPSPIPSPMPPTEARRIRSRRAIRGLPIKNVIVPILEKKRITRRQLGAFGNTRLRT